MSIYSSIESNVRKTWLVMVLFIVFITGILYVYGQYWAGADGLFFAGLGLIIAGILSWGSYYYSDKIILEMSHAKQIEKHDVPQLFNIVQNLSIGAGMPMPKIYVIDDTAPNAFATGRDPKHAVVAVTTGLLQKLQKIELEGVIAHELSHIKNFDTRLIAVVSILVGMVALLADIFMRSMWYSGRGRRNNGQGIFMLIGIVLAIVSPLIATLIQLAISRRREFLADASGSLLTRYPEGLASALEKIASDHEPLEVANNATASLFIVNPFKGKDVQHFFSGLFNTHPPIEERIKILRSM